MRQAQPVPFVRMEVEPGAEAQVDFGQGAWVTVEGKRKRPHLFRIVLSHSRKGYSEVVWRQLLKDECDKLYNQAWSAYEHIREAEDPDSVAMLAEAEHDAGNYDEAIRLLRKALSRFDDAEIAAHLGEVLWVTGNQQEARVVWQKALQKSPDDPVLLKVMQRFIP